MPNLRNRIMNEIVSRLGQVPGVEGRAFRGTIPIDHKDKLPLIGVVEDFQRMQAAENAPKDQPRDGTRVVSIPINIIGALEKGAGQVWERREVERATELLFEVLKAMTAGKAEAAASSLPGGMRGGQSRPFGFAEIQDISIETGTAQCSNSTDLPFPHFALPMTIRFVEKPR